MTRQFIEQLKKWIDENRLLRIEVVVKKAGRKSIVGRLLQFNPQTNTLLVYADDQKTVECISIYQIDDIFPSAYK